MSDSQNYYDSHLKTCIKAYKPHFKVEQLEINSLQSDQYSDKYYKSIQNRCKYIDFMKYVKIQDEQENKKKLLVVFQSEYVYDHELNIFKEIFSSFVRKDLILNLYDSYLLDPEGIFYVFETECYDLTSETLSDKYNISKNLIDIITQKQLNYIFDLLGLQYQENELTPVIYANIFDLSQIQIKINIFDFFLRIQNLVNSKSYGIMSKFKMQQEEQEILQDIKIDESLVQLLNEQISNYDETALLPLSKEKFKEKIQLMASKKQQSHFATILEIVSQHPQYNDFEILSIKNTQFELSLNKSKKPILLVGIMYDTIEEAERVENEYKKFHLVKGKCKSNLLETYIFELGNCKFLLLEFEQNSFNTNLPYSLYDLIVKQQIFSSYQNEKKISFSILKDLINISYELFENNNIRLTDIDPEKIYIEQNQENFGFNSILFDGQNLQNSMKKYFEMTKKCFEKLNSTYQDVKYYINRGFRADINHYYIIKSYLRMISKASKENQEKIQKEYQNLVDIFGLLSVVIDQNFQIFKLKICQYNSLKLAIQFYSDSEFYNIEQLKNIFTYLNQNQELIHEIRLRTNTCYSKVLKCQVTQKYNSSYYIYSFLQIQQQDQTQNESILRFNQNFLQEIGFTNTLGYENYNIGLSLCEQFKNLQYLSLEFTEGFNFSFINENSYLLKHSEQIVGLELILKSIDVKMFNLIKQIKYYKNLTVVKITIQSILNNSLKQIRKMKQIIHKIKRLVIFKVKEDWRSSNELKIDDNLGFFF
ncbi:hypothetical protein ABPG73_021907 [Tetrahymena malaccensis]